MVLWEAFQPMRKLASTFLTSKLWPVLIIYKDFDHTFSCICQAISKYWVNLFDARNFSSRLNYSQSIFHCLINFTFGYVILLSQGSIKDPTIQSKMWDSLIVDLFSALFLLSLSLLILNSQCAEGAWEINSNRVPHLICRTLILSDWETNG